MTWDLVVESVEYEGQMTWYLMGEIHKDNKFFNKTIIFTSKNKEDITMLYDNLHKYLVQLEMNYGWLAFRGKRNLPS